MDMHIRDQFTALWVLAVEKHEDQMYGDRPYITHIEDVIDMTKEMLLARKVDIKSTEYWIHLCIACGHDLIEDTDVDENTLREIGIAEVVIEGIRALSRQSGESLQAYVDRIKQSSHPAVTVKMADASSNLHQSLIDGNEKRIKKYLRTICIIKGFSLGEVHV